MKLTTVLLAAAIFAGPLLAQEKGAQPAVEKKGNSKEDRTAITVHGHWLLEVRNPDGSLASRREFENSLQTPYGQAAIAPVLAGMKSAGNWAIAIQAAGGVTAQNYITPNTAFCTAVINIGALTCNASLTVTVNAQYQIVLQGTTAPFPSSSAGGVNAVDTYLLTCAASVAPATCTNPTGAVTFSYNDVVTSAAGGGVSVVTGQTVTATVTLSFM